MSYESTSLVRSEPPVDVSIAGWFLIGAGIWELLFNRVAFAMGFYNGVGMSFAATSGHLAMNFVGIMALVLACISVPRIVGNPRIGSVSLRVVLVLATPLYLPLICVAIFKPVSELLILIGYMAAAGSAAFIGILLAFGRIAPAYRRIILALGLIQLFGAFELLTRVAALFHTASVLEALPGRAYLLAEVLFVVTPIYAFLSLRPGTLISFMRRPHLLGLGAACIATGVAVYIMTLAADDAFIRLVAYRALGITVAIPGGPALYLVSLFAGTWLVFSLILPSRRWPPTVESRRVGIGMCCTFIAGIQPTHPYQFVLLTVGFFYLLRGVAGEESKPFAGA